MANWGGSAAYDVQIKWNQSLRTADGKPVHIFGPSGVLPVLLAGDQASFLLGASHAFLAAYPQATWSGTMHYQNAGGDHCTAPFTLSAEHERLALVHNEEEPKTQFELQKIPDRLEDIASELSKMRDALTRNHQPEQPTRGRHG